MELVGEIRTGVNAYYDQYQEDQKFLIGHRDGIVGFVIGNTRDLKIYVIALENYDKEIRNN
jgi:hypothetical protein